MTVVFFDENDLLRRISKGDQNAFQIVYDKYNSPIYSYALYLLKSDSMAEEIVQETFLKLWRLGDKLTAIKQLEGYLITLARNDALDHLRKSKLQVRMEAGRKKSWREAHNETEEQIILGDTRRILQEAIDLLPPQQKLVYELCRRDGLKYDEVAQRLNLSVFTVQSYMKVALSSVRKYVSRNTDVVLVLLLLRLL